MFRPLNTSSPIVVRLFIGSGFLLLVGLLFLQFTSNVPGESSAATERKRVEKVNLALRRTADRLLRVAGDSTSRIPAVQQLDSQTFRIALGHTFDYDQLPDLLQQSLQLHKIAGTYDVAVLDCTNGELQLGYSVSDLLNDKSVTCGGRSMTVGCYMLQLRFDAPAPVKKDSPIWSFIAVGSLLVGVFALTWRRAAQVRSVADQPVARATNQLHFGQSCLDVDNQTLLAGADQHKLTYREAKLLRLLVNHPNQVLERDHILKLIWEDEGVTVGRSLDVFISRLRKLLNSDPTIKIAAVHGVGYRLDVQTK